MIKIINESINEKEDFSNITYRELMKELVAINRKFDSAEIVLSEQPMQNTIPEFAVIWKSSPGAVSTKTVQDHIKELNVVTKEAENLNKEYAGKYFGYRDAKEIAMICRKLEKEFPKLTKKYFGKEIKVLIEDDIDRRNEDPRYIGWIYLEDYNEETAGFLDDLRNWSKGLHRPKNYRNFMDELHKIGVEFFASDWGTLYVMRYPVRS